MITPSAMSTTEQRIYLQGNLNAITAYEVALEVCKNSPTHENKNTLRNAQKYLNDTYGNHPNSEEMTEVLSRSL